MVTGYESWKFSHYLSLHRISLSSPLQAFSLEGELVSSILTEDRIVGAYHFDVFRNPVTKQLRMYITDFWDSAIKVFDMEEQFIEPFSEKGFGLGHIPSDWNIHRRIRIHYRL